ncbi:MAG: CGGC domain-containing protein [Anaeromicrobium sp.]|jgi:predicted metal-binding protein|uniref:CGGC domain-containing protein n=1 Tax=Anaeromicrobium sp. TaxID=1929132 RepID=UPI0025E71354|nr:CGGC domain-containing protein [Anaeromicrobium sp.]MCT4594129.1 CGGC domain-containing protein [Anaeromicrobium sp.]
MKIGIIIRKETADRCTGKGCMRAFFKKEDSFKRYEGMEDVELVAFMHSGGDLEYKINKLKELGVDVIHLSTCMRGKYENYEGLAHELSKDFHVVGYTHGSENGKSRDTVSIIRQK